MAILKYILLFPYSYYIFLKLFPTQIKNVKCIFKFILETHQILFFKILVLFLIGPCIYLEDFLVYSLMIYLYTSSQIVRLSEMKNFVQGYFLVTPLNLITPSAVGLIIHHPFVRLSELRPREMNSLTPNHTGRHSRARIQKQAFWCWHCNPSASK